MTTFWTDRDGRVILATSDPRARPPGAEDSTTIAPDSARHQTWDGAVWVDDPDRTQQEQHTADRQTMARAGEELTLVLTELVDFQLENTAMQASDFTPKVRQAYLNLKAIADRVKT